MFSNLFKFAVINCFCSFILAPQIFAQVYSSRADCCEDTCDAECFWVDSVDCCESICSTECFWFDAEYLYWKVKDSPAPPPLVIKGSTSGPRLGDPGTKIVLGDKKINTGWHSGGRFALGYWIDSANCYALEGSYFFLANTSSHKSVKTTSLDGAPQLGVPFKNSFNNEEASYFLSYENEFTGYGSLKVQNDMQSAEANVWLALVDSCSVRLDLLLGFRYWNFYEKMTFFTSSPFIQFPNDVWKTKDIFAATNNFYGGQIGLGVDFSCSCFFLNIKGKVALGEDFSKVHIKGKFKTNEFNSVFGEGPPKNFTGGIFALPTNIGKHCKSFFSVIPEVNVNVGYQFSDCLKLQAGYTFLYVSKLLWGINQIDRTINYTQSVALTDDPGAFLVGPKRPHSLHRTKGLWVQGVSAGLVFSY